MIPVIEIYQPQTQNTYLYALCCRYVGAQVGKKQQQSGSKKKTNIFSYLAKWYSRFGIDLPASQRWEKCYHFGRKLAGRWESDADNMIHEAFFFCWWAERCGAYKEALWQMKDPLSHTPPQRTTVGNCADEIIASTWVLPWMLPTIFPALVRVCLEHTWDRRRTIKDVVGVIVCNESRERGSFSVWLLTNWVRDAVVLVLVRPKSVQLVPFDGTVTSIWLFYLII